MFLKQCFDLTKLINHSLPQYTNDPHFYVDKVSEVNQMQSYAMEYIHIGNHTGTHIDFPAHVINGGKNSLDFPINCLMGKGYIVKNSDCNNMIEYLRNLDLKDSIIFFKNMEFLPFDLACFLVDNKVKIIGVDSLSVDNINSKDLPIHNLLLKHDILIVENLYLDEVDDCSCYILINPLKLISDGLPARVLMWHQS